LHELADDLALVALDRNSKATVRRGSCRWLEAWIATLNRSDDLLAPGAVSWRLVVELELDRMFTNGFGGAGSRRPERGGDGDPNHQLGRAAPRLNATHLEQYDR
jgi:hypothetical protein